MARSLNRTSVGLKPDLAADTAPSQREPQSNQRGIETSNGVISKSHQEVRLNRTSVGLKPGLGFEPKLPPGPGLNRTSVGLKPSMMGATRAAMFPRLNRTSVGLKLEVFDGGGESLKVPQSNQRGIETTATATAKAAESLASIEPAWD